MRGGDEARAFCPICEGTGVGRAAPAGVPCGYCVGRGWVPRALVAEVRGGRREDETGEGAAGGPGA